MDKSSVMLEVVPFLKKWEGLSLKAYADQGGRVTIGYGHTGNVQMGTEISQEQAEKLLIEDIEFTLGRIEQLVVVPLTINQTAALSSFVFNLGPNNA